jgi:XTP/dITP diphosphohydrolase
MIVLATRSAGKLRELKPLFAARGLHVVDLDEAGVEDGPEEDALEAYSTFEENALAKARYFHRLTGRPTAADDSGIAVSALDGRPGGLSKRWSARPDLSGQRLDDENNRVTRRSWRSVGALRLRGGVCRWRARAGVPRGGAWACDGVRDGEWGVWV